MFVEGRIYTAPDTKAKKVSKKGTPYLAFNIQDIQSMEIYKLLAFGDQMERLEKETLKHGDKIVCELRAFDTDAGGKGQRDDIKSYILQGYQLPDKPKKSIKAERQTELAVKEARRQHEETFSEKEAEGLRWVLKGGREGWRPLNDCIEILKFDKWVWVDRLEFCQDVLGAKKVRTLLPSLLSGYSLPSVERFREAIKDLIKLAIHDYGVEKVREYESQENRQHTERDS